MSEFLQESAEVFRIPVEVGGNGQNSCGSGNKWSEFLLVQRGVGIVAEVGGNGQKSFKSRQER